MREAREETRLDIPPDHIRVVGVMHRKSEEERIDFFLSSQLGSTPPRNVEADKCAELVWAKLTDLPVTHPVTAADVQCTYETLHDC